MLLGKLLGEQGQLTACKEIVAVIDGLMNNLDVQPDNLKEAASPETLQTQHLLVVALQELGMA